MIKLAGETTRASIAAAKAVAKAEKNTTMPPNDYANLIMLAGEATRARIAAAKDVAKADKALAAAYDAVKSAKSVKKFAKSSISMCCDFDPSSFCCTGKFPSSSIPTGGGTISFPTGGGTISIPTGGGTISFPTGGGTISIPGMGKK